MPCTANTHPSPTTPATVRPQAASAPTIAAGCPPTQSMVFPLANSSATGAAGNTTPAPSAQALALLAIVEAGILADSLYFCLVDTPRPSREQVALLVGQAGQMRQHAEDAIGALVNLYTELMVSP